MTGKWKPGKWSVIDRMTAGEGWAVRTDHVFRNKSGGTWHEYVAQYICDVPTANLLAASPDLYAALETLLKEMQAMAERSDLVCDDEALAMIEAKAALSKARVETP